VEEQRVVRAIALVAVDLDGTLLTSHRYPAPEGVRALRRAARQGVRVVLATTRTPNTVRAYCHLLELADPMICANGAQVWASPGGPVWAQHCLPHEVALAVARLADSNRWQLGITVGSTTYWHQRPGQALGPIGRDRIVVANNADAVRGDVVRMLTHQAEAIEAIGTLCRSRFPGRCRLETYYRSDGSVNSLGIFARRANKGAALGLVLARLGIASEQALAIGDNPKHLTMFPHTRIFVAMANAPDTVKQAASAVAPSNDDEGVASAIHQFVLSHG
jgi:Cof subfamily protein (haloacid dehalogenase superfamily)